MTIRILENQGQRNIAPFLVNAVLHYVQCTETPDMSQMLAEKPPLLLDRNAVEDIVWGILRQQGIIKEDIKENIIQEFEMTDCSKEGMDMFEDTPNKSILPKSNVNDEMRAMITRTLSAFRTS